MSNSVCENCGQPIMEGDAFCLNCGIRIATADSNPSSCFVSAPSMPMPLEPQPSQRAFSPTYASRNDYCFDCGARIREGWLYCMNCGRKLDSASNEQDEPWQRSSNRYGTHEAKPESAAAAMRESSLSTDDKRAEGWFHDSPIAQKDVPSSGYDDSTMDREPEPDSEFISPTSDLVSFQPFNTRTVSVGDLGASFSNAESLDLAVAGWDKTEAGFDADSLPTSLYNEEDDDEDDDALTMIYQDEEAHPVCTLTRLSTGERLVLELPAIVGRGSKATARILSNPYIGRQHIRVFEQDGNVYVEDLKSANHSYLNGEMLLDEQSARLADGDTLVLAKEEFSVSIE